MVGSIEGPSRFPKNADRRNPQKNPRPRPQGPPSPTRAHPPIPPPTKRSNTTHQRERLLKLAKKVGDKYFSLKHFSRGFNE